MGHAAFDAGPQHLDRHPAAVGEQGGVGLRQRGGGDRRTELDEQALDRAAEGALHLAPGLIDREGRQGVLQAAQVAGEFDPEDVGAGGQHLAQLDGHRAEVFEGPPEALAGPSLAALATGEQVQQVRQRAGPHRQQRGDLARRQGVVADQHAQPAEQAHEGLHRPPHRQGRRRGRRRRGVDPSGQIAHPK